MDSASRRSRRAFSTPWFELVAKEVEGSDGPYYSMRMPDYVTVVPVTPKGELVLVRQLRPAVEEYTLELPAGHVEPNLSPEESARLESAHEEAGYVAPLLKPIGTLASDTGRNQNRMWCYLAEGVTPAASWTPEPGVDVVLVPISELRGMIGMSGAFPHALHIAVFLLALMHSADCLAPLLEREP